MGNGISVRVEVSVAGWADVGIRVHVSDLVRVGFGCGSRVKFLKN